MVQKDVAVAGHVHRIGFDRLELHELQAVRVGHDPCHLNSRIGMASRWIASTDQHAISTVATISLAVCVCGWVWVRGGDSGKIISQGVGGAALS